MTMTVDDALKYVAAGFARDNDDDREALDALAAEVERLRTVTAPFQAPREALYVAALEEHARLQKVVADQALTIGTLKDIVAKQTDDFEKLRAESEALRTVHVDTLPPALQWIAWNAPPEVAAHAVSLIEGYQQTNTQLQKLLSDERSLSAAAAQHTTALERKVAELSAKWTEQRWPTWDEACNVLMTVHGPETAVYQAARVLLDRVVELELPKPGAAT